MSMGVIVCGTHSNVSDYLHLGLLGVLLKIHNGNVDEKVAESTRAYSMYFQMYFFGQFSS